MEQRLRFDVSDALFFNIFFPSVRVGVEEALRSLLFLGIELAMQAPPVLTLVVSPFFPVGQSLQVC